MVVGISVSVVPARFLYVFRLGKRVHLFYILYVPYHLVTGIYRFRLPRPRPVDRYPRVDLQPSPTADREIVEKVA